MGRLKDLFLRLAKRAGKDLLYFVRLPPRQAWQAYLLNRRRAPGMAPGTKYLVPCGPNGATISLRANSRDADVFEQIFLMRDCDIDLAGPPPDLIIDAGAHIGCAATRFALRYPGAKILAVEAERRNFEALRANMARFPNVQCIHAAVWGSHGRVALADPDEEAWAFRVQPLSEETSASSHADYIPAVTVDELLAMAGAARIDLLKLDIEGAEKEVFNADVDKWLPRTRVMNIELHDRVTPGCTEAFNNALGRYHFKIVRRSRHNLTVENVA